MIPHHRLHSIIAAPPDFVFTTTTSFSADTNVVQGEPEVAFLCPFSARLFLWGSGIMAREADSRGKKLLCQ